MITSNRSRPRPSLDSLDTINKQWSPGLVHGQTWVSIIPGVSFCHLSTRFSFLEVFGMKENRREVCSNEYGACGYRKYEVLFWKLYQNQITLAGVSFIFPLNIKIMLYVKIVMNRKEINLNFFVCNLIWKYGYLLLFKF